MDTNLIDRRAMPVDDHADAASSPDEAWQSVCRTLRAELGADVYTSWFGRLELKSISAGVATLTVPTRFLKSWIQTHYKDLLRALLESAFAGVNEVAIELRSTDLPAHRTASQPKQVLLPAPPAPAAPVPSVTQPSAQPAVTPDIIEQLGGSSPLDPRMIFAHYFVGAANQLAHAGVQRVLAAQHDAPASANPLFLHGAVGHGKTHLIQALAHEKSAARKRVVYLTAERFMYDFAPRLGRDRAAVQAALADVDLFILDDVQFLRGKFIEPCFAFLLNFAIDRRRPIVLAADRPAQDIETLDPRTVSRLAAGLCLEIGTPDQEVRRRIVTSRIMQLRHTHPSFSVSADVINYVASVIETNGRDLDGAVNRLLAHMTLSGTALTVEMAQAAIRDLIRARDPKRVRVEDIQKLVATHYNVSRADLLSARRTANVVRPRQIAMYLAKVMTLRSLPEVGRRFGGRDHTTVLHAVRKIETLAALDAGLASELQLLSAMLQE